MKVQGAVSVTLTFASGLESHFKLLRQSFLCDGQGADRQAILSEDSSCCVVCGCQK